MPTLSKLRQEDSRYSAKRTIALIEQCLLMLNVLKVRIYPNQEQQIALAKNFGCCRFVWNYYLHKTEAQYKETGKALSYCDMAKDLTQLKKAADYSWLKEATAAALQQSLKNLESAFKNFFQHRARFPRFKSKPDQQSIRYPESCSIRKNGLKLPKLGIVKAKITRPVTGQIKSVTLTKTSTDKFFASILFETDDLNQPASGKISDIDLGLNSLVTVFDGESCYKVDPIKPTRKYAKRLKHRQQSKAAVKVAIEEILDQLPESYPTDAYQRKCEEVYQHVYESYSGAGRSIYNAAA